VPVYSCTRFNSHSECVDCFTSLKQFLEDYGLNCTLIKCLKILELKRWRYNADTKISCLKEFNTRNRRSCCKQHYSYCMVSCDLHFYYFAQVIYIESEAADLIVLNPKWLFHDVFSWLFCPSDAPDMVV
jgi:hypothetical protein